MIQIRKTKYASMGTIIFLCCCFFVVTGEAKAECVDNTCNGIPRVEMSRSDSSMDEYRPSLLNPQIVLLKFSDETKEMMDFQTRDLVDNAAGYKLIGEQDTIWADADGQHASSKKNV